MFRSTLPALVLAVTFLPAAVSAQAPTLRRVKGDTLRYHQTVKGTQNIEGGPMSGMQVGTETDNRFAVAYGAADTVRVWFESASSKMTTPQGEMSAPTEEMLYKPYVMKLSATGKVQQISVPSLGGDPGGMLGLMPQFWGFELAMPSEPLRVGAIWTDTVDHKVTATGGNSVMRKITTYRISRDSTFEGQRVFIIETTGTNQVDVSVTQAANNMTMKTSILAEETGRVFFSPARAIVLSRTMATSSKGTQSLSGPMEMSMNITQKMETTLALIR